MVYRERLRIVWMINAIIYHATMAAVYTEPDKLDALAYKLNYRRQWIFWLACWPCICRPVGRNGDRSWPTASYTISQLTWLIFRVKWTKMVANGRRPFDGLSMAFNFVQNCPGEKECGMPHVPKRTDKWQQKKNRQTRRCGEEAIWPKMTMANASLAKMTHDNARLYRSVVINHGCCA